MPHIVVAVQCAIPHRVSIDTAEVPLQHNGTGIASVVAGGHTLAWAAFGRPGDTFKAVLTEQGVAICTVDWAIPGDEPDGWTGDYQQFKA
ncbi:MAG TPA: hypothetical protein VGC92_10425 [Phenylobacterium sp.]|jgi:hypothetical protein